MPRPGFPPTPAPSTDIVGKENAANLQVDPAFKLPPTAYSRGGSSSEDGTPHERQHALPSPTSPRTTAVNGRKESMIGAYTNNVTLPPPPTRTRKIIQMKPGQTPKKLEPEHDDVNVPSKNGSGVAAGGKKKAGSGTSAGRKIARKTAHSLIERRRRSKMNEEFGVLKDMIPACNGQEMHKLAILQASIDYLRYLEQCVADLKAGRQGTAVAPTSVSSSRSQSMHADTPGAQYSHALEEDMDEEMEDTYDDNKLAAAAAAAAVRPTTASSATSRTSTFASPAFTASYGYGELRRPSTFELPSPRGDSYYHSQHTQPPYARYPPSTFSVATPPTTSNHASPMMLPQPNGRGSHYSSPMILPQPATVLDHEASAALLMLNASDRRMTLESAKTPSIGEESVSRPVTHPTPVTKSGSRGMSVKDLLRN